jgi:hypothetical protein
LKNFIDSIKKFSVSIPADAWDLIQQVFGYARGLEEEIQRLRDEIARLKQVPEKPDIKKGKNKDEDDEPKSGGGGKRGGSRKERRRQKKHGIQIHETKVIAPPGLPPGAKLLDVQEYTVQDIEIKNKNTRYMIQRWLLPDGTVVRGDLPIDVVGHYGIELRKYVLYQFHHNRVTEPLLLEELRELGVLISSGQLHKMLVEGHELFHQEKQDVLSAGLSASSYVQADDTGSRHNEKNGFTTVVCNNLFTVFESTESKSRVNFLEVLLGGRVCYRLGIESLEYLEHYRLPPFQLKKLKLGVSFSTLELWAEYLKQIGIQSQLHVRLVTEAALLGALLVTDINPALIILSDDAGQFNIFKHALCWIHAERLIKKLEPMNDAFARELELARSEIWNLYDELTAFKKKPTPEQAVIIQATFDELFQRDYQFTSLKLAMRRLYKNKAELLVVLSHPSVPLHNNQSESDVREKVVRRKISVTFNDESRKCRDSFASLKKTCRKLGITFWSYLGDRLSAEPQIQNLGVLVRAAALAPS